MTASIAPSMERELRAALTEQANEGAIRNFALNLRPLLMQPPVRGHVTMGLDPGYSHGCKVAVVDPTGKVLDTAVVYPTFSKAKRAEAIETLRRLMDRYEVTHIALGNGTASRETEAMVCELLRQKHGAAYMIVSEAGASVYSASPLAAEEFRSTMSTCAARSPSRGGCRTHWPSWSRSTRRPLASVSISTTCRKSSSTRRSPAWWRIASMPSASI